MAMEEAMNGAGNIHLVLGVGTIGLAILNPEAQGVLFMGLFLVAYGIFILYHKNKLSLSIESDKDVKQ